MATVTLDPVSRGLTPAARHDIATPTPDGRLDAARMSAESAVDSATDFAEDKADDAEFQLALADQRVQQYIDRDKTVAHNIVGASITLGLAVIMLILMAIVAGYFVQEAPSNGAFSNAITEVENIGGTAFILLAVALLAVPVVAIVGFFMRSGLGGFISTGGMGR